MCAKVTRLKLAPLHFGNTANASTTPNCNSSPRLRQRLRRIQYNSVAVAGRREGPIHSSILLEVRAEADNPINEAHAVMQLYKPAPVSEKIALGKQLFFDKRLSADGNVSCATCHDPRQAFTDGLPVAAGIHKQKGTRNTPTLINAAFPASVAVSSVCTGCK